MGADVVFTRVEQESPHGRAVGGQQSRDDAAGVGRRRRNGRIRVGLGEPGPGR